MGPPFAHFSTLILALCFSFAGLTGATAQTIQTIYSFNGLSGWGPGPLTLGNDGNFYGTTYYGGGSPGNGTVFKVTTNGTLTTLVSFNGSDGGGPIAALTLGNDGNFYGTTYYGGGSGGYGTVFMVTTNGTLTTLVSFNSSTGVLQETGLKLGKDGNFYGITGGGGSSPNGTVFRVTTNGTLTTLASFNGSNGQGPNSLTLGNDGNFYGTTGGGSGDNGTVFQVTPSGTLTMLVSFNGNNGVTPNSLSLGKDGNFYGTTGGTEISGPSYIYGRVFRATTNGTLTTLASFDGSNGRAPSSLTLGKDGNFYGTTYAGGNSDDGTIFCLLGMLVIAAQPESQATITGATVRFFVGATSQHPISFQWQKNGTNLVDGGRISGATNSTLTIDHISDADTAVYRAVVTDVYSSVTTSNALLTAVHPPSITMQPSNSVVLPGTAVSFVVSVDGTVPHYQWRFNGKDIPNATNAIYAIPSVATNNAGSYALEVTNLAGAFTSANAFLAVVLSPKSQTIIAGETAMFTAPAFSPESLNYQWQKNGANLVNGGTITGATSSALVIANVSDSDAAAYRAIVSDLYSRVSSAVATLSVVDPPSVTNEPISQTVLIGSAATLGVTVAGSDPLAYQWRFNGTNIPSATNATYSISAVVTNNAGFYTIVATNWAGSATSSNAALAVVLSPKSQTIIAGETAMFTAPAFSPESLNYQWQKNGANLVNGGTITGATSSALIIANVSDSDVAAYRAIVSDGYSSVTTSNAVLTVGDLPFISVSPLSQTVIASRNVTLFAIAYGAPPLVFQWYFNGAPLGSPTSGTNFSSYTLTNIEPGQAGYYSVVVVNGDGNATSSKALLTVIYPPSLALEIATGYPLLSLRGVLSSNFVVQYRTSLEETNWMQLLSLTNLSASPYQFLDPAGVGQSARFYRAFMK